MKFKGLLFGLMTLINIARGIKPTDNYKEIPVVRSAKPTDNYKDLPAIRSFQEGNSTRRR